MVLNFSNAFSQSKNYEKEWSTIEQLEIDGKVATALEKVDALLIKASNRKNAPQQLKALLFRWKFLQIIDEKSQATVLKEVKTQIAQQTFPNKEMLHIYMATFLETYLNNNYWQISKRTNTEKAELRDYLTWDQNTLLKEISFHYDQALKPAIALVNISTTEIEALLVSVPENRKYQPSIYDIIANKALTFYTNSKNRVNKPKDEFLINSEIYFKNSNAFSIQKITTTDTESLLFKGLKTYQKLEFIHSQQQNNTAWIHNALARLRYVKNNYIGENQQEHYVKALQRFYTEFQSQKDYAKVELALAKAYNEMAASKDENGTYSYPDYNQKAMALIAKIEHDNSNNETVIQAQNLKKQILQKRVNWITQDKYLPNKLHLAKVTFANAKSLTVNAYQVPFDYNYNKYPYNKKDSLINDYLSKRKRHFSKKYDLPSKKDFNSYSSEITVPKLPIGNYVFRIQTDTLTNSYKYHFVKVTELSINKKEQDNKNTYQVVNRYTGSPIKDTKIIVKTVLNRNYKEFKTKAYTTNAWGEFSHSKSNRYANNIIIVQTANDTLQTSDYSYRNRHSNINYTRNLNKYKSKTLLFLDRAIYRPKQTVYFKAIAISEVDQKSNIIANTEVSITVKNPNNEKVHNTSLTTNEYGSVSGEFKLPDTGLNGNYSIIATIAQRKNTNTNQDARISFSVEEYKRPTFEVTFLPATKIYKPLDSITVKGNAKAFLGNAITNATVTYSVKRTTEYRNWWYYSRNNNESKQIAFGKVQTDDSGNYLITFKAVTDEVETKNKIYNYSIEAKVTDLNGETRENTTNIKVADENLLATINTSENWNSLKKPKLSVSITDVNQNPIKANGTIKIYKLQSPKRFLNARPWSKPDIQTLPEKKFNVHFPHIPYTNENDSKNWKKGKLFFKDYFTAATTAEIDIKKTTSWPAGKYAIAIQITDPKTGATIQSQKTVNLQHPNQRKLTDEELFNHITNYDSKNPGYLEIKLLSATPKIEVFIELYSGNNSIWKQHVSLEGLKELKINLPKLTYPKVTAVYKYQIYNHFYTSKDFFDFEPKPVVLSIEKKHFTDKINPGVNETWSFSVKSSDQKAFNAEALATMYDASLDQFKRSNWNTHFGFRKNYPSPPISSEITRLRTESTHFNEYTATIPYSNIVFEKFNFFGLEFNTINSWKYRNYLRALKLQIETKAQLKSREKTFTGKIISNEEVVPFVDILVQGTHIGTTSDINGNFSINAKLGDTLIVSSPGFLNKKVSIKSKKDLIIHLEKGVSSYLNAAVIEGYSKSRKKELTGAIREVRAKNLESIAEADISSSALQGQVAGVSISTSEFKQDKIEESDLDDLKNIKARKNLQETAFFLPNLRTNKKGEIDFEFTSPEALTRWNFRILAHTTKAASGTLNSQTLTQKDLSIIPNAPRFVREGDVLHFTAKIANLTTEKMSGIALLEWTDPNTGNSINSLLNHSQQTQNFSIDANGNSLVSWKITIPENLTAIQYKIVAKANNFTDGEEKIIPVLSNRMLVTESIPLWVRAGETESFSLANFEPNSPTQKPHKITLEYTSNPAWMAIKSLPYLMEFPHECSEQTFSRLYANTLASYILNSQPKIKAVFENWRTKGTLESPLEKNEELKNILLTESPWLREAQSEAEQQKRLALLFDLEKTRRATEKAINKLRRLQKSNGGFPWFQDGYTNPYITRHILAGFGHLEKLGVTSQRTKTDNIVKSAIRFLSNELIEDYNNYLKHHKNADGFYTQVQLLHLGYAFSFYNNRFPIKGEAKNILDKALDYQKKHWQERSVYEKGLLALTLYRFKKSPVTQQILTALTESAVNSKENGMYWKANTNSWWWYLSPITTQALLIEAYTETNQPKKYIEEMKIFLLKNKRTNRWKTTIATANASYALLLQGSDWLSVKENTHIKVGGTKIAIRKLAETEKEQGTGYFKTSWEASKITPNFKTITVTNKSKVTNYGGYYWQYFEDLDHIETDDANPLSIDKELYKKVVTKKGPILKRITTASPLIIGDKITIRLIIKSNHNMEFVHLKDMHASGFEPTKVLSGYEYKNRLTYYQNIKDVATHFFIDRLNKGTYVLEYDVIANQNGSFSNGISSLQCMYAPEFSSHSAGQRIEIK